MTTRTAAEVGVALHNARLADDPNADYLQMLESLLRAMEDGDSAIAALLERWKWNTQAGDPPFKEMADLARLLAAQVKVLKGEQQRQEQAYLLGLAAAKEKFESDRDAIEAETLERCITALKGWIKEQKKGVWYTAAMNGSSGFTEGVVEDAIGIKVIRALAPKGKERTP